MAETKHTPGEWRVDERGDIVSGPYNVAILYACKPEDKRLMAAAPSLHQVVVDLFENPQFQVAIGGNPIMVDALMARARSALALAVGEG